MKKLLSLLLCLVVATCGLVGCGGPGGPGGDTIGNTDNDLEIYCIKKGYDVVWFNEAVELFKQQDWVKEKYPNLKVSVEIDSSDATPMEKLSAGSNYNTTDLMFGNSNFNGSLGSKQGKLLNLTDVLYNSEVPGENVLVKDKMIDGIRQTYVYGPDSLESDQYYSVPYVSGMSGILYNKTILDKLGMELPNTTDEFIKACADISVMNTADYNKGYAVILNAKDGYWKNIFEVFWGQYSGIDALYNFYNGIVGDIQTSDVFKDAGRLKALEFYEELFKPYKAEGEFGYESGKNTYKYLYPYANEASNDYIATQSGFLSGNGVFHMNGNYFQTEMALYRQGYEDRGIKYDFRFMKTPVLSSIIENVPDKSIANDAELSALIKAIDAGNSALKGEGYEVTQKDYDKVKQARGITSVGGMVAVIPEYASAKEAAVDFLRFLATDICQEKCYVSKCYGLTSPYKCSQEIMDRNADKVVDIYQSSFAMLNDANVPSISVPTDNTFPYGIKTFHAFDPNSTLEGVFSAGQASAQKIYQAEIDYWAKNQAIWTEMMG